MAAEVADGGRISLAHFDEAGLGESLEGLTHGGPGHAEHLGQTPLTGQHVTGLHVAAEHLRDDLLEDVFGYRSTIDGLQGHPPTMAG